MINLQPLIELSRHFGSPLRGGIGTALVQHEVAGSWRRNQVTNT